MMDIVVAAAVGAITALTVAGMHLNTLAEAVGGMELYLRKAEEGIYGERTPLERSALTLLRMRHERSKEKSARASASEQVKTDETKVECK